ncbi:MAG: hypothetical protein CM15mP58_03980 [Burkholderiaceae bacterium]|nr:MAG: hypothetical protein CM15mP58_03980 [Burkholderiaceae bacterium]
MKEGIGTLSNFKEKISDMLLIYLGGTNIILDAIGWLVIVPVTVFYLLKIGTKYLQCKQILPLKLKKKFLCGRLRNR